MVDISKAFGTSSEPIAEFFQRPGVGYYIPLYQREYSWDEENIDQLMEDIRRGVESLLDNDSDDAIHFMGTVILIKENKPFDRVQPQDKRALPSSIYSVIDGQQRISTITLLASQLYQRLYKLRQNLLQNNEFSSLKEAIDANLDVLQEFISVDLKRGSPSRKPIIVRGSVDKWTFDEGDDNYRSDVSSFLAKFIRSITEKLDFPQAKKTSLVGKNIKEINLELDKVENAHLSSTGDFPCAWDIIDNLSEEYLWDYERPEITAIIQERGDSLSEAENKLCSLIQLFSFCYYLFQRCCFTLIEPVTENRAFDMFQSLNATGTPLTALETFKPLVVNFLDEECGGFKGSTSETYFNLIDKLTNTTRSASAKNKLTNDYLTTFALIRDGSKLPGKFSDQRRWLNKKYDNCQDKQGKEEIVREMAELALYQNEVVNFKPNGTTSLPRLDKLTAADRELATLCVLYLQDAGHKMANAVLSRFYSLLLRDKNGSEQEFLSACKAVAAFYTLWRSALSNAGLDDTYRKLLEEVLAWEKSGENINSALIKNFFSDALRKKDIGAKDDWLNKAKLYLRYDNVQKVCKFALFIVSHDTIPDPIFPGLMKVGVTGASPLLSPTNWKSDNFKTIEHVAPQNPSSKDAWDKQLYEGSDDYEQIGNLILLPTEINASASNKSWLEKLIYYKHLAETDPAKLDALEEEAKSNGISLKQETVTLLKQATYSAHVKSIVELGDQGEWDKELVLKRTERICKILWQRLSLWLDINDNW